jgi:F-type H+-transporting ATPase subunit b
MSLVTPDFGLLVWMTVIFAILFFILAKFGFPIITRMVDKRSDYIGKSLSDAREARNQLASFADEQQKMIDDCKREQTRLLNEAAQTREELLRAAREQASVEAAAVLTRAREDIAVERENAMRDVRREVAELSVNVAEKVLRDKLDNADVQNALIERLIDEADRQHASGEE